MRGKINEFQVGLLTLAAVVLLVGGMLWFQNVDLTKGTRLYQVDFARVEGMREGDKVQVRGIRMGEVSGMRIMQAAVRVELQLDESVDLREDAVVTLGEKGIVGEVVIEIDPGVGGEVIEGHIFQGRTAGTIASMTDAAGAAISEMRVLTTKVTELVEQVKAEGKVVETLEQANATLTKVDAMITDNHNDVTAILADLRVISQGLRDLIEGGHIQDTFAHADAAMTSADSLLVSLNAATAQLTDMLGKLNDGDGAAARLMNDPALYTRTDSTLTSMQRLLDDMRRNPKKYFKLNVVDF